MSNYNYMIHLHFGLQNLSGQSLHLVFAVILRLPFLTHNNIVVDASACTATDKKSGFDLLNPVAPPLPPLPPKKLKDFFHNLQEDCKPMVSKLKMVCVERPHNTRHKFEPVKPVDVIAAMREHIKILAAQSELKHLGKEIMSKFKDVFSVIPYLDEPPTDVYCRIKPKDTSTTR